MQCDTYLDICQNFRPRVPVYARWISSAGGKFLLAFILRKGTSSDMIMWAFSGTPYIVLWITRFSSNRYA